MDLMTWTSNEGITYERVAGSIRKIQPADAPAVWVPIDEPMFPGHKPVGNWAITAVTSAAITVSFLPKIAVVSAKCGGDETYVYEQGMTSGLSVGLGSFVMKARSMTGGKFNPLTAPANGSANFWFEVDYVLARPA